MKLALPQIVVAAAMLGAVAAATHYYSLRTVHAAPAVTFEYKIEHVIFERYKPGRNRVWATPEADLNALGKDRWELVSAGPLVEQSERVAGSDAQVKRTRSMMVFKRQKTE